MIRPLLFISITAFWLAAMGMLIQKEFFQISTIQTRYEILPIHLETREEYNAMLMGDDRIGFNFTVLEPKTDSENPEVAFELRHQTFLSFLFLSHNREMLVQGSALLDRNLYLVAFNAKISSSEYWTKISGRRTRNDLNVLIESNESQPVRKIVPLKGPIFYSEVSRFIWTPQNLHIGKQGSFEIWNPLMTNFQTVEFQVKEKTTLDYENKKTEVFVIHSTVGGIEIRSWVSPEGVVLKEESLTGLTALKQEGWQIFDAMREKKSAPPDLPNLFSIPANKSIDSIEQLRALRLRISTSEGSQELTIKKASLEGLESVPFPFNAAELAPYLAADEWIDARDPEIMSTAKKIIGGTASALEASQKLMAWVHKNVSPVPSMTIPKAKQVLALKKGDCNEYTILYTALSRSLGIPTRMIAGLVYQQGRFFYHAWPEIYIGKWMGIDPTFNQFPIDVGHIPLVAGGLEEQIALVTQLGQLKVEILE